MSETFKIMDVVLSEADRAVIAEGKIPVGRSMFEMLMHSLKLQIDNVHGQTESYFITLDNYNKGILTRPDPPLEPGKTSGAKKRIQKHLHVSDADKAGNTPHAAWHVLNDIYISIVKQENIEHEEKTGEPAPKPPKPTAPKKTIVGLKTFKPIPKR